MFLTRQAPLVLFQSGVAVSHTGNTNETTLATIAVPAGTIGANGQVDIEALFSHTNNANAKNLRIRMGSVILLFIAPTANAVTQTHTRFANRNSQASQVLFPVGGTSSWGSTTTAVSTLAENTALAVNITITAQLANAADTITLESYLVKIFPKA